MSVRRMLPLGTRDRAVWWEVTADDGAVIGWLEAWSSSRGRAFYRAFVVDNGERLCIESSADFEERVDSIVRFSEAPNEFTQHRPRGYSAIVDDPNRIVHG